MAMRRLASQRAAWRVLAALLLVATVLMPASSMTPIASGASSGQTALFTAQGSAAALTNGDYVSASGGLNTFYRFFIEVPPGLPQLTVEVFDPDVGAGGANEDTDGRDRDRTSYT